MPSHAPAAAPPELIIAALDPEHLSGDQGVGHDSAGLGQNPAVGLPGYAHQAGRSILVHPFVIA